MGRKIGFPTCNIDIKNYVISKPGVYSVKIYIPSISKSFRGIANLGYRPTFKNATYWSNKRHWKWATEPNARERASFLSENILPLQESGQLKFIDASDDAHRIETGLGFDAFVVNGHTDAQMCPIISHKGETLVFMADLLPSVGHIPIPYVMGYDTRPMLTLEERKRIFNEAADHGYHLFLEHDASNEICTLKQTEKGPRVDRVLSLKDM